MKKLTKAEQILKDQVDIKIEDDLRKTIADFFNGPGRIAYPEVIPANEPEYLSDQECEERFGPVDSKIHKGFMYQIKKKGMTLITGTGGAENFIQQMRENGYCEYEIGFTINVTMDEGLYTSTKFYPIHYAIFKNKE